MGEFGSEAQLRAGLVGLGRQARKQHLAALTSHADVDLVVVCDTDPDTKEVAEAQGLRWTSSVDTALEQALDFVVIATPHSSHAQIVTAAARTQTSIFKEKPLAVTLEAARMAVRDADRADVHLYVNTQRRFMAKYVEMAALVHDHIGDPFAFEMNYTMDVDVTAGWRSESETAGGGALLDMGYHTVDAMLWFFGSPSSVIADFSQDGRSGQYDVEDTAQVLCKYEGDLTGQLFLSRAVSPKEESARVAGTEGTVQMENNIISLYSPGGDLMRRTDFRSETDDELGLRSLRHFLGLLDSEAPPSNALHLAHMSVISACYASARHERYMSPGESA